MRGRWKHFGLKILLKSFTVFPTFASYEMVSRSQSPSPSESASSSNIVEGIQEKVVKKDWESSWSGISGEDSDYALDDKKFFGFSDRMYFHNVKHHFHYANVNSSHNHDKRLHLHIHHHRHYDLPSDVLPSIKEELEKHCETIAVGETDPCCDVSDLGSSTMLEGAAKRRKTS